MSTLAICAGDPQRTLNHRDPSLCLVRDLGLTTKTHDLVVIDHARDHPTERIWEDLRIGIDTKHELVAVRTDARHAPNRVEELVLERRHALVEHDLLQERHEHDLRVALATVTRLRALRRLSDLDHADVPNKAFDQHRQETQEPSKIRTEQHDPQTHRDRSKFYHS